MHTILRPIISILVLFILPFLWASATRSAPDEALTFEHKERSLQPGELIRFEARCVRPLKNLTVKAFDREFPAFAGNGGFNWTALAGIDLDTKPGQYKVELCGIGSDGESVSAVGTLDIKTKKFPTRELTVDEKYVTPPADVQARIERESKRVNAIFASNRPEKVWNGPFRLPVPGEVISVFGKRSIYNGRPRSPHAGVDFRGGTGTPIRAPNAGIVVLAADLYYSGNTVILDHGMGLYSYLGHMSSFSVKEGDRVEAGGAIGKIGSTGVATGPHLHWTIRLVRARIDPMSVVDLLGGSRKPHHTYRLK
jgi:murein DD-endopeptidase MepM/ murein hydrolase activator NlpD